MDYLIEITEHAYRRGKERLGWNKKVLRKMVKKVFDLGLCRHQTKGTLSRYLDELYNAEESKPSIKIYGEFVYIFVANNTTDWKLLTMWKLPNEYIPMLNNFHKSNKVYRPRNRSEE